MASKKNKDKKSEKARKKSNSDKHVSKADKKKARKKGEKKARKKTDNKSDKKAANKARKKAEKRALKQTSDKKQKDNNVLIDGVPTDKVYVKDSKIHGKGMFAAKKIKKNTVLGPLLGYPTKHDGTYVLWLSEKKGLRVTNDYRFINHSDKPNCALSATEVFTLRSIKPGEELTHHYGWED